MTLQCEYKDCKKPSVGYRLVEHKTDANSYIMTPFCEEHLTK
jgi:hypothetical protein